jgi:molybdopterin converting factor small subunit
MVKVKFYSMLAQYMKEKDNEGFWVIPESDLSIDDVLAMTDIVSSPYKFVTFVNNARKSGDYILKDGDALSLIPLVAGG